MCTSVTGGGASVTVITAKPCTPFAAIAAMMMPPVECPLTTPASLTLATSSFRLTQKICAPGIAVPFESNAVAVRLNVPPTGIVTCDGTMETLATTACGGGSSLSLHAPNVLAEGPDHTPAALRDSERPGA